MEKHIFYQKYANMPLEEKKLDQGGMSAHDVYKEMQKIDAAIQSFVLRQEELLRLADKIFKSYE